MHDHATRSVVASAGGPPTALASLAVGAVHSALHDKRSTEKVVKAALRAGARSGDVTTAEQRAVLSSTVFGTSVLRARLSHMLAAVRADGTRDELLLLSAAATALDRTERKRLTAAVCSKRRARATSVSSGPSRH
jgi:hypothetical protein